MTHSRGAQPRAARALGDWAEHLTTTCARPLAWFAAALALGVAFGRAAPFARDGLAHLAAALAGAWAARRSCCARVDGGHGDAQRAARTPGMLALALVAVLGALRAPWPERSAPAEPSREARALLRGRWCPANASERGEFGRLVGADDVGRRVLLPLGAARGGELLELVPSSRPFRPARGLAPGPSALGSLDSDELWRVQLDELRRLEGARGVERLWEKLQRLREQSLARCERFGAPHSVGLARALIFGDESRLSVEVTDLFTRTGVRHVLSVSGMHVALLAGALSVATMGISGRIARRAAAIGTLVLVAVYSALSGAQPPVRRAALTLCLGLMAALWTRRLDPASWRRADALNLLAAALAVELYVEPRTLFTLSLQLSYSATAGLVLAAGPVSRWIATGRRRLGAGLLELAWTTPALRALARRCDQWFGEGARLAGGSLASIGATYLTRAFDTALGASLAATLATAPITWVGLGEISWIGVLATVCVGPLVAWMLIWGLAAVYLPLPTAGFDLPCEWLLAALEAFDLAPWTPLPLPPRPAWLALAALAGMGFWASRSSPALRRAGRVVAQACAGVALLPWTIPPAGLEVVALDVGHGTAVALRTARNEVWLVDAGTGDRHGLERRALGPQLASWEASTLNVALTHRDRDHGSALPWVAERWRVATWIGPRAEGLRDRALGGATCVALDAGALAFRVGQVHVAACAGSRHGARAENEASLAVALGAHGRWIVVSGDATASGVDPWLASGALPSAADVLLWPHHGDPTERASELLEHLAPRVIWISAARPGGIEAELERRGVAWDATFRSGPLRVVLPPAPP